MILGLLPRIWSKGQVAPSAAGRNRGDKHISDVPAKTDRRKPRRVNPRGITRYWSDRICIPIVLLYKYLNLPPVDFQEQKPRRLVNNKLNLILIVHRHRVLFAGKQIGQPQLCAGRIKVQ